MSRRPLDLPGARGVGDATVRLPVQQTRWSFGYGVKSLWAKCRMNLCDSLFLVFIVFVSALPYVFALGFYSDDWAYESTLSQHQSQSAWVMFRALMSSDSSMLVRPVQPAYLASGFKVFGLNPVPYHALGTLLLGFMVAALYFVLREWGMQRGMALAISLVYGLLPHYSTDRFWISSQQATLCVLFASVGIYAMLRLSRPGAERTWAWGITALSGFVLSFLSYGVVVGPIAAALTAIAIQIARRTRSSEVNDTSAKWWVGGIASCLFVVGICKISLQNRIVYNHNFPRFLGKLGEIARHQAGQAIQFNLWSYGLRLPWVIVRLGHESALDAGAIGSAAFICCCVIAFLWAGWKGGFWRARSCLKLVALGFAVYALGIFLFARELDADFSSPGINNRIAIASALGTAMVWIGIVGLACRLFRREVIRRRIFAIIVGLICGANCLTVNGIASYWIDSARKQAAILSSVRGNVTHLTGRSVLMLDGYCRYDGPSPVFETDWDTSGALQLAFDNYSLVGDAISSNARFTNAAIDTISYGDQEGHYSYSKNLLVYNVRDGSLHVLDSHMASMRYLQEEDSTKIGGCAGERDGYGTRIF